ncbi:Hypothetical predicted protein [Pelobates cultripes]|uniref:Small integral membrane protein 22 n=1 Tax=Pelobates cultripes TaxID=61616 RepID=A0AAD1WIQ0_PELCU|nr:Hypothetical predicted protein [Pelobates cultripes]
MSTNSSIQQQFQDQWNDVLGKIASKQIFQSDWDIAAFVIFFTFIGLILFLIVLVLIRCFCCCCCDCDSTGNKKHYKQKIGVDNHGMEL